MPKDALSILDQRTHATYEVPIHDGTIRAMDLRQMKTGPEDFGLMTYDPAFMNTASCRSSITFIDGDRGILRYRGYPIEQLAEKCTFLEVAYLLLFGDLPTSLQLKEWVAEITHHTMLHETTKKFLEGFRYDAHPMGMLTSTVAALSTVPHPRSHLAPNRGMDHPAGPQPNHGHRRPDRPGQVHDPRPRLEPHHRFRCRSRRRRDPDRALQHPDAPDERHRRTLDRRMPPRAPGSHPHLEPGPPETDPEPVRNPPQSAPPAPRPPGSRAAEIPTRPSYPRPALHPKTGSRRWPDQRISPGRLTWTRFSAPTTGCRAHRER